MTGSPPEPESPPGPQHPPAGYLARVERAIIAARARIGAHRTAALATAGAVFVVLCVFAVRSYARLHLHPDPLLLVAAFSLALPAIALNAAEFALAARVAGQSVTGRQAVTVSVAGSAANLLPLPGAALVRSSVMVSGGVRLGAAAGALTAIGLVWVGVTAAAVGVVAVGHSALVAAALAVAGVVVAGAGLVAARHRMTAEGRSRVLLGITLVEMAIVASDTVRMWLVLRALGVHASAVEAFALTAANVLATVTGVLPGGLGLREALSAVFGAASGLPSGLAVTGAATDRLGVLVVLAAASATLALATRRRLVRTPAVPAPGGHG